MKFSLAVITMLTAVAVALPSPAEEATHIMKRTCGTLTGEKLKACQLACKALCDVGTGGIAKKACEKACDLGPLKVRDTEVDQVTEAAQVTGKGICDAACDVVCNSTVAALEQKKCLVACKAKCH